MQIDYGTLKLHLSQPMRDRIARGEMNAADVIDQTTKLIKLLTGADVAEYEKTLSEVEAAMERGAIDALATCTFNNNFDDCEMPLLNTLIYASMDLQNEHHTPLINWVVRHADIAAEHEVTPAYYAAYRGRDERFWHAVSQHPDFDVEATFEQVHKGMPHTAAGHDAIADVKKKAAMLEHECLNAWQLQKGVNRFQPESKMHVAADALLAHGAVVPPEFMGIIEKSEMVRQAWQMNFSQLREAIASGNKVQVQEHIGFDVVAQGFSLGYGEQMCNKEFWGEFWDEGKAALLALPDWVQERLAPSLSAVMARELPQSKVIGGGEVIKMQPAGIQPSWI